MGVLNWLFGSGPPSITDLTARRDIAGLKAALTHPDETIRGMAAGGLATLGREAVPVLRDALESPWVEVRLQAVIALGNLDKGAESIPGLCRRLKDSADGVRASTAVALGKLLRREAVPALLDAVNDPYSPARSSVLRTLGILRDSRALSALIAGLGDPNDQVSHSAAVALGRLGDPQALPALERAAAGSKTITPGGARSAIDEIRSQADRSETNGPPTGAPAKPLEALEAGAGERGLCGGCRHTNQGTEDASEGYWACPWLSARTAESTCGIAFEDNGRWVFEPFDGGNGTWGSAGTQFRAPPKGYEKRSVVRAKDEPPPQELELSL